MSRILADVDQQVLVPDPDPVGEPVDVDGAEPQVGVGDRGETRSVR
jgi:hypothetical protein